MDEMSVLVGVTDSAPIACDLLVDPQFMTGWSKSWFETFPINCACFNGPNSSKYLRSLINPYFNGAFAKISS